MKKNSVFVEFEKLRKKQRKEVPAHSHESFDRHTNELIGLLQTVRKMTKTEQKAYWALVTRIEPCDKKIKGGVNDTPLYTNLVKPFWLGS